MEYGYVIYLADGSTVSEGEFGSYAEAADEMSCQWQDMEDRGEQPVDYEICEG